MQWRLGCLQRALHECAAESAAQSVDVPPPDKAGIAVWNPSSSVLLKWFVVCGKHDHYIYDGASEVSE